MTLKLHHYDLPRHWASALVNGDLSGVEADDRETLNKFVNWMVNRYGQCICINVNDEDGGNFKHWHDATEFGALPCDVARYAFDVTPQKQRQKKQGD